MLLNRSPVDMPPKSDTFERVRTVADLLVLEFERSPAPGRGGGGTGKSVEESVTDSGLFRPRREFT